MALAPRTRSRKPGKACSFSLKTQHEHFKNHNHCHPNGPDMTQTYLQIILGEEQSLSWTVIYSDKLWNTVSMKLIIIWKGRVNVGEPWLSLQDVLFQFSVSVLYSVACVQHSETYGPIARQTPLSIGFSTLEYWSGLPFPSPGDLPEPWIEPTSPMASASQVDSYCRATGDSPFGFYPYINKNLERSHLFKRTGFIVRTLHTFKQVGKKHLHVLEVKCLEV